jgi:glycerate dehydrogenase
MKACILDADSLGPGLDLGPLREILPQLTVWGSTEAVETQDRLKDMQIVLSNKVRITEEHIKAHPQLRYIGVLATGTNNVAMEAAEAAGIVVCNVQDYATDSVVQHTLMLLLALAGNLKSYTEEVAAGKWQESKSFCYYNRPINSLEGKIFTLVGFGHQGQKIAELVRSFGMKVEIVTRRGRKDPVRKILDDLLPSTDVLSFHCPLKDDTFELLHEGNIFKLKKGALVLNCARGGLVNEEALAKALNEGHLGGAGFDVATVEPPPMDHPLMNIKHPNFILTPHIAWASNESRQRLLQDTIDNLKAFFAGKPRQQIRE